MRTPRRSAFVTGAAFCQDHGGLFGKPCVPMNLDGMHCQYSMNKIYRQIDNFLRRHSDDIFKWRSPEPWLRYAMKHTGIARTYERLVHPDLQPNFIFPAVSSAQLTLGRGHQAAWATRKKSRGGAPDQYCFSLTVNDHRQSFVDSVVVVKVGQSRARLLAHHLVTGRATDAVELEVSFEISAIRLLECGGCRMPVALSIHSSSGFFHQACNVREPHHGEFSRAGNLRPLTSRVNKINVTP